MGIDLPALVSFGASPNVLIIEDQDPSRLFLVYEFRKLFPRAVVYQAATLEDSLKKLQETKFQIVFIDPGLPDYDATDRAQRFQVVQKIIQRSENACHIIFTGFDDLDEAEYCMDAGAKGYLAKTGFGVGVIQTVLREIETTGFSLRLSQIARDIPEMYLVLSAREQEIMDRIRMRQAGTNRRVIYEVMAEELNIDAESVREYHQQGRSKLRRNGIKPDND